MDPKDRSIIQSLPGNDKCIDCGEIQPQWASVKFGTLFCLECSGRHRGLGVQTDFVRSITLDSWTPDQLSVMKAGGNSKCIRYFQEQGVPKEASIREKYESQVAQHYKKALQAAAKGEPAPPSPEKIDSFANNFTQNKESIEELVRSDPSLTFGQAFHPVLSLLTNLFFESFYEPSKGILACIIMLGLFYKFRVVRVGCFICFPILFIGITMLLVKITNDFVNNRQSAFKSAHNLLLERIRSGRAMRKKDAYDVFLPAKTRERKLGLIFYPGASVNHTAYAPIAAQLSDQGILVVVMSLEPLRITNDREISKKKALNVMYEVLTMDDVSVDEWSMAGHSAGAALAFYLVTQMKPGISKLVVWGLGVKDSIIGPFSLRDAAVDVLVLNGSEDGMVNAVSEAQRMGLRAVLPPPVRSGRGMTTFSTIKGGNHAGFGHYGPQTYPIMDGTRTITMEEQQRIAVQQTVDFLFENGESEKK